MKTRKDQINKPQRPMFKQIKYEKGKTIGRNQKFKAEIIFKNAKNIRSYTLSNGFSGELKEKNTFEGDNWMWQKWIALRFAKLVEYENNNYELYLHGNAWFKFEAIIN